jgi:hypothetical protein
LKLKILFFLILIILISSSLVFADDYPYYTSYYSTSSGKLVEYYSKYPIVAQSSGSLFIQDFKRYIDGNLDVIVPGSTSTTFNIYESNHDIYYEGSQTVFFKAPTVWMVALKGALQKLLSTILPNLPIILGMLVLAIGLRKAYRVLSVSLKGA